MLLFIAAVAALQAPPNSARTLPAAAAVGGDPSTVVFPIRPANPRADLPFEFAQGGIVFKAAVGGQPVWMLLDNGTTHNSVDLALARSQDLKMSSTGPAIETADGTIPGIRIDNLSLDVPGQFTTSMSFSGIDMASLRNVAGHKIEAFMGRDLLAALAVAINPQSGKLAFFPGGQATPTGNWHLVALKPGPADQVVVQIDGQQLTLTVDLGWTVSDISLTPAAWARVRPRDAQVFHEIAIGAAGQPSSLERSRLPLLTIGDLLVNDVDVSIRPWPQRFGDGLIGIRLLTRYQIFFDIKGGRLGLKELPGLPAK